MVPAALASAAAGAMAKELAKVGTRRLDLPALPETRQGEVEMSPESSLGLVASNVAVISCDRPGGIEPPNGCALTH